MGQDLIVRDPPPSDEIHPGLYGVIAGFALLFIVSAFASAIPAIPTICWQW